MDYFIHPLSDVQTKHIGLNSRIWQFVVILPGARIGSDVNICAHCLIEGDTVIGDRVTIKSGVQLWNGLRLEDDVFVGPNVTFTNDHFPRSKKLPEKFLQTLIQKGASIGANATVLPGLTIAQRPAECRCHGKSCDNCILCFFNANNSTDLAHCCS